MIVIALVAIVASLAVPQFGRLIDNNRVVSTTNSIVGLLSFSRSEAIRRGARITATAQNDTMSATLTADNSLIRQIEPASGSIDVTNGSVTFRANGLTTSGANVTFSVCTDSPTGRLVTVTPGGRVETTEMNCP
jgi:Tfp pilus assembly protein FimT